MIRIVRRKRMTFREAVAELEKIGITGADIYLIDLLPLIDMIQADGRKQDQELAILELYKSHRIDDINRQAGHQILSDETVRNFINRFLAQPPDEKVMRTVRSLLSSVLLSSSDEEHNNALKNSLLATAIDIGASNVEIYPYPDGRYDMRFNLDEKKIFMSLLAAVHQA